MTPKMRKRAAIVRKEYSQLAKPGQVMASPTMQPASLDDVIVLLQSGTQAAVQPTADGSTPLAPIDSKAAAPVQEQRPSATGELRPSQHARKGGGEGGPPVHARKASGEAVTTNDAEVVPDKTPVEGDDPAGCNIDAPSPSTADARQILSVHVGDGHAEAAGRVSVVAEPLPTPPFSNSTPADGQQSKGVRPPLNSEARVSQSQSCQDKAEGVRLAESTFVQLPVTIGAQSNKKGRPSDPHHSSGMDTGSEHTRSRGIRRKRACSVSQRVGHLTPRPANRPLRPPRSLDASGSAMQACPPPTLEQHAASCLHTLHRSASSTLGATSASPNLLPCVNPFTRAQQHCAGGDRPAGSPPALHSTRPASVSPPLPSPQLMDIGGPSDKAQAPPSGTSPRRRSVAPHSRSGGSRAATAHDAGVQGSWSRSQWIAGSKSELLADQGCELDGAHSVRSAADACAFSSPRSKGIAGCGSAPDQKQLGLRTGRQDWREAHGQHMEGDTVTSRHDAKQLHDTAVRLGSDAFGSLPPTPNSPGTHAPGWKSEGHIVQRRALPGGVEMFQSGSDEWREGGGHEMWIRAGARGADRGHATTHVWGKSHDLAPAQYSSRKEERGKSSLGSRDQHRVTDHR
jgi:hypothetical protein